MKINESKLKEIISEEMAALEDKKYFDYHDNEGGMAKSQLYRIAKYAMELHDALEENTELESWVQSKITKAADYMGTVKHHLEYEMGVEIHSIDSHEEKPSGCGDAVPLEPSANPMMVIDDTEEFEIDDEDAYLMES